MTENLRRAAYLNELGIVRWVRRDQPLAVLDRIPAPRPTDIDGRSEAPSALWETLAQEVRGCTRCGLHADRTQTVFGVGPPDADWMVIGEAPGADEDRQGEPFVGRAGKLLNSMLLAVGLRREQVYIANMIKCRPPGNRDPRPDEVNECRGYLKRQIALIKPKLILVVGRIAAQHLLRTDKPLSALRGHRWTLPGADYPVVVTYHPAYLLRSPEQKAQSWQDLRVALRIYNGLSSN